MVRGGIKIGDLDNMLWCVGKIMGPCITHAPLKLYGEQSVCGGYFFLGTINMALLRNMSHVSY